MSKFNNYAVRLDEAFKESRKRYEDALNAYKAAEEALSDAKAWHHEEYHGQNAERRAAAEARFSAEKIAFENAKRRIWPAFEQEAAQITRELETAIRENNIATPDQIDLNGLELLKSGVMTADDYESMVDKYNDNPTMLKMISKYADEAAAGMAQDMGKVHERARLTHISITTRNGRSVMLQDWDNLITIARTCAGISRDGKRSYLPQMGAHWDTPDLQEVIKNF